MKITNTFDSRWRGKSVYIFWFEFQSLYFSVDEDYEQIILGADVATLSNVFWF